eukprot:GEMP01047913.1.p1 GENE.GEMP01047913.1~~GEMP01047913.1.p1  ORF type:complete len:329 (+),score=62.94 GEMP01047913.1:373-1359(+)
MNSDPEPPWPADIEREFSERTVQLLKKHLPDALKKKNALRPPEHSHFRVLALVIYEFDGEVHAHYGSNWDICSLGGSICAERVALTSLRVMVEDLAKLEILGLLLVTDADVFVTPGPACREFMSEFPSMTRQTPIMLVNGREELTIQTLERMWPYPCHYRAGIRDIKEEDLEQIPADHAYAKLYAAVSIRARKASKPWYNIAYAAAVQFDNGDIKVAETSQALEYSCSLDAVLKLFTHIEEYRDNGIDAVALLFCDQFGRLHAPFASARALLSENDYDVAVILHDETRLVYTRSPVLYDRKTLELDTFLHSPPTTNARVPSVMPLKSL